MPSPFSLKYFDPPTDLKRHILVTFFFATDAPVIEDRHPGALGQFVLFPRGNGAAQFGDRFDPLRETAHMYCGFRNAAKFRMDGPWHAIGASLSPLGWAALTGKSAHEHMDRVPEASEFLGQDVVDFSDDLNRRYRDGQTSGEQACHELADWIGARLKPVPAAHERVIEATIRWLGTSLNPEMDELFASTSYSRRQAERVIERYFGLPPAALARKYRAVRAAALLSNEGLSDEGEAEIADAFVDQPHMIREIRKFCGYTPSRLGGATDPIFQTLLQMKNLDRLDEFRAIG